MGAAHPEPDLSCAHRSLAPRLNCRCNRRMRQSSRVDYETRLSSVVSYVEEHIAEELSLEALARRAALSPYHFHRVFRALTGEPLGAFVQRRRLEKAARDLHQDRGARVIDVALRYGYESPAAFTRAFRKAFAVSPATWRKGAATEFMARSLQRKAHARAKDSKIGKELSGAAWHKLTRAGGNAPVTGKAKSFVEHLPNVSAVRMRYVGPYGSLDITRMWDRLVARADAAGLIDADTTCSALSTMIPRSPRRPVVAMTHASSLNPAPLAG